MGLIPENEIAVGQPSAERPPSRIAGDFTGSGAVFGRILAVNRIASFWAHTLSQLAFLAVLLLACAPQSSASWQCEGRVCGTSIWTCCCVTSSDSHDADCGPLPTAGHFSSSTHAQEISDCPAKCHCTVTTQSSGPTTSLTSESPSLVAFLDGFVVAEPIVPELRVLRSTEAVPPMESRGPPANAVYFASPCLRGPPLA
jgi:hypothetical protein